MAKQKKSKNVWEPEYRYQEIKGQFVDYRGETRDYTMVAVSIPYKETAQFGPFGLYGCMPVEKVLTIGVAVRCNRDADNGMGARIAYGKAVKNMDHTILASHSGLINTTMVGALLQQEAAFFEKDPGMYLKGYDNDRRRYEATGRIAPAELTESEAKESNNKSVVKQQVEFKPASSTEPTVTVTQVEMPSIVTAVHDPNVKMDAR